MDERAAKTQQETVSDGSDGETHSAWDSVMRLLNPIVCGILLLSLVACGGGGSGSSSVTPEPIADNGGGGDGASDGSSDSTDDSCGVPAQLDFVEQVSQSWYLWFDELAAVDKADYTDPEAYLDALTAPLAADLRDPGFSYLTSISADEARFTSGAYIGFGFRYTITGANQFIMIDVFEGSPAHDAGFRRGWELLAIDLGTGFETMTALRDRGATSEEVFGTSDVGVERLFRLGKADTLLEAVVAKVELDPPALAGEPLLLARPGNSPVAYLNLRQFILSANDPLSSASQTFADAGVTDMVVDLRYNGGGLLSVVDNMMDLLGGGVADGALSFQLSHNSQHTEEDANQQGFFNELANTMTPQRIAFITSGSTASASELVINALDPHIEVVLIGADTYGKAVGQYAFDLEQCDVRLRLTAFEIVNGEGQGGYYTGLYDTGRFTLCSAQDDIFNGFGDPQEASLAAAMDWLATGTCQTERSLNVKQSQRATTRGAVPAWWRANTVRPDRLDPTLK